MTPVDRQPIGRIGRFFGRIGVRLLLVNLTVLIVPVMGLEFARLYERQLLASLERDMRNQAAIARAALENDLELGGSLPDVARHSEAVLTRAAQSTRTRVRLLDVNAAVVADTHRAGPPEGEEPEVPSVLPNLGSDARADGPRWPDLGQREEVMRAMAGSLATRTRVRARAPAVVLFLAEPVLVRGRVAAVVYVTRSTQPVLLELYKIRTGLFQVMAVAFALTAIVTFLLERSISAPLHRLGRAAGRVARGELHVAVPIAGSGEVRELALAFAHMKERLVERLRFAGEFAADVAHELKSPLTSIRGAAELLEQGAWQDPVARERFIENIRLDVERLDRIVTRLLLLGRIEASDRPMAELDLGVLGRAIVDRLSTDEKPIGLDADAPVMLAGRADDLEIAISNLIENAQRYTPKGERVGVAVHATPNGALVRVENPGPPISPNNLSKIFERFFTTDAATGGTGLGLAIVKSVAEAHGGTIGCAREGDKTVFELRLPRST
ncbi:MAG: HAMP domain-containing histidine kinase [Myxococcales bacterium]|nr:HAMP domain-containing histidine kinase [Myxococcales bacterium]